MPLRENYGELPKRHQRDDLRSGPLRRLRAVTRALGGLDLAGRALTRCLAGFGFDCTGGSGCGAISVSSFESSQSVLRLPVTATSSLESSQSVLRLPVGGTAAACPVCAAASGASLVTGTSSLESSQ